jgi:hypothetical protein
MSEVDLCPALWQGIRCRLERGHEGKHQLTRIPHFCHWPGCKVEVEPKMLMCAPHWFRLPLRLRNRIWSTYRNGQELDKDPSPAYVKAAIEVQEWIKENAL